MARIPSLTRHTESVPARDENRDGRIDDRDATVVERDAAPRHARTSAEAERLSARDRDPDATRTVDLDRDGVRTVDERDRHLRGEPEVVAPVGPRPRASLLATLGLIAGVAGALFVLTGALAGYGVALGAIAVVLSVLGLVATRRRHVAGKVDATIGLLLGLGAVVLGVIALTAVYSWPTADGDWVQRFREWLDSQFADRF